MRKWMKRVFAVVACLLVLLAASAAGLYYLAGRTPDWVPKPIDPAQRAELARSAQNKLQELQNLAVDSRAAEAPDRPRSVVDGPTTRPGLELSFTEEEINAFFGKVALGQGSAGGRSGWATPSGRAQWYDRYVDPYVSDPALALRDGKIIFVGTLKDADRNVSVHFKPQLDDEGRLRVPLAGIYSGSLPLPSSMLDKYRQPLARQTRTGLPLLQRQARIESDGSANEAAMRAAMRKLFLAILDERPAEPVLFLPADEDSGMPVKLTDIRIEDRTLSFTLMPLGLAERKELLQRVREPYGTATASTGLGD